MIDRRQLLAAGGAATAAAAFDIPLAFAADVGTLRVATLKFGSLGWVLEIIKSHDLATKAGLKLDVIHVANSQAASVSVLSGDSDMIISDWLWALRERAIGIPLRYAPYSSALGAVMVPGSSPIKTLQDFKGRTIGVSGGPIDKSWLLLRAYARNVLNFDIAKEARPSFGASPLLTAEVLNGRLDGVLNFWTYAARMEGEGARPVIGMDAVLEALGIAPIPSLVGFIWREQTEAAKAPAIAAFLSVVRQAQGVLATSDDAWDSIRHLVRPETDAEFAAIKAYYRAGIPQPWGDAQTKAAQRLVEVLADVDGAELLGPDTPFDPKLFYAT